MQILNTWEALASHTNGSGPCALAIGAFDGLHTGHQALIQKAVGAARQQSGTAWLLTFDPHPSRILRPDTGPLLLTSTEHKLRLLQGTGLDGVVVHPFTADLAGWPPETFLQRLRSAVPNLQVIVVGANWRFGRRASGDVPQLKKWGTAQGVAVEVPAAVEWQGAPVSSTRIREAIEHGRLPAAHAMLGRPFSLWGAVTTGRQYGRELGFPTANIRLQDEVRPPTGVYAVRAHVDNRPHNGAAYLGLRPTAQGIDSHHLLEVHLFDVTLDLYGQLIEVAFVEHLRPDQRFPDATTLQAQIARDVARARTCFTAPP